MIVESYPAGMPSWVDLMTSDVDAATEFYKDLFGWEVVKSGEDMGDYGMCMLNGQPVAGLGPIPEGNPMPPAWTMYISVDDVDGVVAAAADAGGQILAPVMKVEGSEGSPGRMAIVAEPAGSVFGLWEPNEHKGSGLAFEPGSFTWHELLSRDLAASKEFLGNLFGYEWKAMAGVESMQYSTARLGDKDVLGVMIVPDAVPADAPSYWNTYFAVTDADETVAKAVTAGGSVFQPPMDSPHGRMAVIADPQGATFSVIALPQPQS